MSKHAHILSLAQGTRRLLQEIARRKNSSPGDIVDQLIIGEFHRQEVCEYFHHILKSLTPREKLITSLICKGFTNGDIADHLHISVPIAKKVSRTILGKLHVKNRLELRLLFVNYDLYEANINTRSPAQMTTPDSSRESTNVEGTTASQYAPNIINRLKELFLLYVHKR